MASIQDKLNSSTNRHVSSDKIWKHLTTMYDLGALNESESLPFPNQRVEFSLPEEFQPGRETADTAGHVSLEDIALSKDRSRHESGSSTRGSSKSEKTDKPVKTSGGAASLLDDRKAEEPATPVTSSSAKRGGDGRKRTRHSLQSESTPKRQRRT